MKRDKAIAVLRQQSAEMKRFGVRELRVFGSTARDETTAVSDIDILVDFDGPATFDRYMGLKFFLEDLLGVRVDLVTRRALRDEVAPQVLQEAVRVA